MDCSPPGSSVRGDSPIKNTGVGCHALLQGNLPNPGMEPRSSTSQADSLPCAPPAPFLGGIEIHVFISCLFSEDWLHYLQLLKIRYIVWYDFPSGTSVFREGIVTCWCVVISSVAQSCSTLCNPMDCSTPDLPVHHQSLEFTQTHVHWVGDAIQPSHLPSSPSPPAFHLSQHLGLFKWVSSSHQVAKVLKGFQLQYQSFKWIFRTDFL